MCEGGSSFFGTGSQPAINYNFENRMNWSSFKGHPSHLPYGFDWGLKQTKVIILHPRHRNHPEHWNPDHSTHIDGQKYPFPLVVAIRAGKIAAIKINQNWSSVPSTPSRLTMVVNLLFALWESIIAFARRNSFVVLPNCDWQLWRTWHMVVSFNYLLILITYSILVWYVILLFALGLVETTFD